MKSPAALQALIDDGVVDEVLRQLKSGKEASVYVVRSGDDIRCAKVYKDLAQRSFQARAHFAFLVRQVVRMLCVGTIHGDLSEYNVLVDADGPVIIDLPQAVSAAGNNNARAMLLRDVARIRTALAFFAPELETLHYGEEMWALFERGELQPESVLTGHFAFSTAEADVGAVLMSIEDARQEAVIRQQGREAAANDD